MKKLMKIIAVVAAVVLVLAVALVILASVLITPERVKSALLPLVEQHIHRKVEIGEISAGLFSGIEIHGLSVYEQDGRETFFSTDLVRLRYQLLPLLAMKVVVDEVRIDKPAIRVVRLKDGRFNFSDLTESPGEGGARGDAGGGGGNPVSLLVSQVQVEEGRLLFLDHVLNDKAPYRFEVTGLQVAAKGVSLAGAVPLTVKCLLNGTPLAVDGQVSLAPLGGVFRVDLQRFDLIPFKPYLQGVLPGKLGSLKLSVGAEASWQPDEVTVKGTLALDELDLLLDALPSAPILGARLAADYDLLLSNARDRLELRRLDLDYNGIKAGAKGQVSSLAGTPLVDLAVTVPGLKLGTALKAVPQGLLGDLGTLDPTGGVSVEASLSGRVDKGAALLKSASMTLENVEMTAGGYRPAVSGRLRLDGDRVVSESLQVRLGDNRADIAIDARNLFARPVVKADVTSQRFLLDPLLKGGAGSTAAADQAGAGRAAQAGEELGPFDLPLTASGVVEIAEAVWKGVSIKEFKARYELKDNVLTLMRMDGQFAGGTFSNTARVDLGRKGLAYTANVGLKGIQADPLLAALSPKAAGNLLGAMDLSLKLDGRGSQWESLSRNLSGDGNLQVADGRLVSPGLVKGLAGILQLPGLDDIRFSNFAGQLKISDGKLLIDSRMTGEMLKLFPKGTIGLDGALNLGIDTRLSPTLSQRIDRKGGITGYLADAEGWTRVPLLLKGSFATPSFGLDPKGIQEQAGQALGRELGKQLDKLFKKPAETPQSSQEPSGTTAPPAEDPAQQLLKDSLKKLFGN